MPSSSSARSSWSLAVLFFLVVALLALAVVPILVDRRIAPDRDAIVQVAEPALASISDVQLALAQQMSSLRGYAITGDSEFLERYARRKADEREILPRLDSFARSLGPPVTGELRALREAVSLWEDLIDRSGLLTGDPVSEEYVERLQLQEDVYLAALERSLILEQAVRQTSIEMRDRIMALQQMGNRVTLSLIFLSLAGVAAVTVVGRRLRALNTDLDQRAREEVRLREDADAARKEALERARQEKLLRKAAEAVSIAPTAREVGEAVLDQAIPATRADGAVIRLQDPESRKASILTRGSTLSSTGRATDPAGPSGAGPGEPSAESDVLLARVAESYAEGARILVPLGGATEDLGSFLLLRGADRSPFDAREVELAEVFAELATLALHRVHLLATVERRRRELERVTESRNRLIRGFSHDLKNPLGAADAHASLLQSEIKGSLNPGQKESLERIRATIGFAFGLIEELVELARIEAGHVPVDREPVDLGEVVGQVVEEFRPQAEGAGLAIDFVEDDPCPSVETDPYRVRQVLGNLLSNAIKYTDEGAVGVRVRGGRGTAAGVPAVFVEVVDSGPGIPADKIDLVFDEFSRFHSAGPPGAGLGLAISSRIAHALGGDLTVSSEEGRGSTFTLSLPVGGRAAEEANQRATRTRETHRSNPSE